ncbi:MAG: TauD/TfdA family dioxygenase [Rhodoferax sp.]|uniref:TauD/TfdA family dioxygenase n=1 Tax=Rhodoferax sp. TaxID=50421 RepID=UPI00262BCDC8|nr:TauD/TfdA family dioxygenase [Rhodoferax sp.]MDD2880217.1 TauD/TfdA family dioxygenase [Rhodoferax sp.]
MPNPFDLKQTDAYQRWRDNKLASQPHQASDLIVDVADPRTLQTCERQALLQRCAVANMAIYRSPILLEDKSIARLLANQLGLHRLDGNWLADEDGISPIAVAAPVGDRPAFIPYTNRPIKWHTDGYYQPADRLIRGMVLHCVRPAKSGGETALMDHEMAYIALRDANPDWIAALMASDAMTIPERLDDDGIARPEQAGPVFSVHAQSGELHMRYTARTRSIVWKDDALTRQAVAFLEQLLGSDNPHVFRLQLSPGMGLVCNNVLHDRTGFDDDPKQPRLLYRARYLDRIAKPAHAGNSVKISEIYT